MAAKVKLTVTDLLSDPALALAMAGASVSGLRAQGAKITEMSTKLDALIADAQKLHVEVSGSAASLDERAQLRKKVIADARKLKMQLKQAQARYNKAKLQFLALVAASGIDITPKKKKVTKAAVAKGKFAGTIGALPADLAPKPAAKKRHATKVVDPFELALAEVIRLADKQAKLAPVVTAPVMPVSVSLFGKEVSPADLEKHVEALLQARQDLVAADATKVIEAQKTALADLKQHLAQANAQVTAKVTEVAALNAKLNDAVEARDLNGRRLDTAMRIMKRVAEVFAKIEPLVPTRDAAKYNAVIVAAKLDEDPMKTN